MGDPIDVRFHMIKLFACLSPNLLKRSNRVVFRPIDHDMQPFSGDGSFTCSKL